MFEISTLVFVALAGWVGGKHYGYRKALDDFERTMVKRLYAKEDFAKRVKYIRYLETVSEEKCERHNHQARTRGRLTLAKLCVACQKELNLR